MRKEHSCISAISNRKRTSHYLNVKLNICDKQWDECATDIAHAIQIHEMMIHTILKSAQETETKA
jgi:hypothetical protein